MDLVKMKLVNDLAELLWDESESEWPSILTPLCAGDEALYKEVTEFARHCRAESSEALRAEIGPSGLEVDPEEIGYYRIIRRIGAGGMGVVYKARLKGKDLGKEPVAVKVIKRGLDTETFVRRFRAERYVLGQMVHPNIARIVDAGSTEDGRPFFVMEYIGGSQDSDGDSGALTLYEYVTRRRLGLRDRLRLFQRVCSVVEFAHRRGVVHRDLKPSNILVTPDGEPHLLDFGLAKLLVATQADPSFLKTETGAARLIGTPQFMSPEQARGEAVSPATDIYSLGVLLYYLLTDRLPYAVTSDADAVRVICESRPSPPSEVIGITYEFTQPQQRGLDRVVLKALAKNPADRDQTVSDWIDAIGKCLEDDRLSAQTAGLDSAREFISRYRVAAWAVLVVCIAVVGLAYWSSIARNVTPPGPVADDHGQVPAATSRELPVASRRPNEASDVTKSPSEEPRRSGSTQSQQTEKLYGEVVTKVGSQVGAALDELLAETPNVPSSKKVALRTDGIKIFQALEIFNGADRHSEYRKTFKDYPLSESFDRANVDQAVRTLKTMAQGGNSYAAVVLADRLTWGNVGLKQDARQAFEMARKAAELGNPYGYYLVSDFCSRGVGTQKDESESFRYTVLAAENDVAEAQLSLAEIYAHGSTLVNQDLAKAYMLMSLSATNMRFPIFSGESKQFAAKLHDEVTRKMTPAQMQAAQEQTSEWTKIKRRALPQLRWQGEAAGVKEFMEPLIGQVLAGSGIR